MATRAGGAALLSVVALGLIAALWLFSSNDAMFDVVFSADKTLSVVGIGVFAVAGLVAANSGSGLLRALGRLLLLFCVWMGFLLYASRGAPPELADALDMIDDIELQFAEVASALEAPVSNAAFPAGTTADEAIAQLVESGAVLVGRQCAVGTLGTGTEQRWYVDPASPEGAVTHLTLRHLGGGLMQLTDSSRTTGEAPLVPLEPACGS